MSYRVFKRRCWKKIKKEWVPASGGRKYVIAGNLTLDEARTLCAERNPPDGERKPGHPAYLYEFEAE